MDFTILKAGLIYEFETVEDWNLAIMSFLFDDKSLNAVKDGFGGCEIF